MTRPQFTRRNTQPMRPDSYRRIAAHLRALAYRLDATADSDLPHDKRNRTLALTTLMRQARSWWLRNHATADKP